MSIQRTTADRSSRAGIPPSGKKPPASVPSGVRCLRCQHDIDGYAFTDFTFLPYGSSRDNVILECPKCGHIEFVSQNSPLLRGLNANAAAVGDGD